MSDRDKLAFRLWEAWWEYPESWDRATDSEREKFLHLADVALAYEREADPQRVPTWNYDKIPVGCVNDHSEGVFCVACAPEPTGRDAELDYDHLRETHTPTDSAVENDSSEKRTP